MRTKIAIAVLAAGCAVPSEDLSTTTKIEEPLVLTESIAVTDEGRLEFNTTVFGANPTTLLESGDFHGYNFRGKAGAVVTIAMTGTDCLEPDTFLHLFKPAVDGDRGEDIARNDDAGGDDCFFDSKIAGFTLPVDGDYLIVATSFLQRGGGHYELRLSCDAGDAAACAQPNQTTFQSSRIAQTAIDAGTFTPAQLFSNGFFLFKNIYRMEDGMGNALAGAPAGTNERPNFRAVHQGGFGAPEAQSCATCHNIGGVDGAGDLNHNIFQNGDGLSPASGLPRSGPMVLGLGYRQQIGIEMTNELKAELAQAKINAAATGVPVTQPLTAKGVAFGQIIANPDGTTDPAGVVGVDADLVVKPFGWKGRESLIRRFAEGGFRVHFGMQTTMQVDKHCLVPNPNVLGTGANCKDPDDDGVVDEITEGQLSSLAIYLGLRQVPIRVPHTDAAEQARAVAGEALFASTGCATCHVPSMRLDAPSHTEPADTTGGPGATFNLLVDTREPRPVLDGAGMRIEAFSDYKRHDMGAALADSKDFNQIKANQFITPPLWGIATNAPYMHDGRSATLNAAILAHGGEAQASRDAYAALSSTNRKKIVAFLGTLSRSENAAPAPLETVDLSGFRLSQANASRSLTLPAGTKVPRGGFLVIGRNRSAEEFQQFYGRLFGRTVVFLDTHDSFPAINGGETFTLRDALGGVVDGPTVAMPASGGKSFQRVSGALPAGDAGSWSIATGNRTGATPGAGAASTGANRIYISEFADSTGTDNFNFEFVEIFVE